MALIWGTLRLFALRSSTPDDNFWGFGQCLATTMLVILLFSALEIYTGTFSLNDACFRSVTKSSKKPDGKPGKLPLS
jgi:hypothetical protein